MLAFGEQWDVGGEACNEDQIADEWYCATQRYTHNIESSVSDGHSGKSFGNS